VPRRRLADVSVGETLPPLRVTLQRADLVRYAGASGDLNPIHWNERFAREVGLPDVIAHGMLTMALGARLLTSWAGDPAAVVEYGVRFTHPVVVPDDGTGTVIEFSGTVAELNDDNTARVEITAVAHGRKVLGKASALLRLA
jgi:acyl dehydratase